MTGRQTYTSEFDELLVIGEQLYQLYEEGTLTEEQVEEEIETYLIHAYRNGYRIGEEDLDLDSADIAFFEDEIKKHPERLESSLERKIDGKTFRDRLSEHLTNKDGSGIVGTLLASEYHRNTNEGITGLGNAVTDVLTGGTGGQVAGSLLNKTWVGVMDDVERDSHVYLEGMTVPFESDFYTYNGDHAPFPGMFGKAEEDINCRCITKLSFAGISKDAVHAKTKQVTGK